jgi:hypothetical protein
VAGVDEQRAGDLPVTVVVLGLGLPAGAEDPEQRVAVAVLREDAREGVIDQAVDQPPLVLVLDALSYRAPV